tara:strand:+ start:110 stop:721 length:612 start_codon:yes stop_codon:yes gene_type:complete
MTRTRSGEINRVTKETDVFVHIEIDGSGKCEVNTGIGFLDHMIQQLSSHGLFDIKVRANGDTHIDDHHTNEDVGIAIGQALSKALGDRVGIKRFGHFLAPLDEALIQVVVDCSGRPHLSFDLDIPSPKVGTYDTELVKEFFAAVASNSGLTLHIRQLAGTNTHHIVEASFKSFARALRMATEIDPRRSSQIPSSKGVLEQAGN